MAARPRSTTKKSVAEPDPAASGPSTGPDSAALPADPGDRAEGPTGAAISEPGLGFDLLGNPEPAAPTADAAPPEMPSTAPVGTASAATGAGHAGADAVIGQVPTVPRSGDTRPATRGSGASSGTGYTVLARRYRSRDFAELVGQDAIARTLQNAITAGRVAHAYLFCGTRGVGKTSMARIFARALNATDTLRERDAIADAILRGQDIDVIEIDGASNRGVQEARDLIASAGLSPARCPYRIYIIDEVHMLTKDAFNTLLKTMEEPPAHVKFILCTTEPNKVPATIQSRCQRFDFRAIPAATIARHLRRVVDDEGIRADDAVLRRVAAMANGSMRDGLSLLERLLAGGEREITAAHAEELLGLPDLDVVVRLVDAISRREPAAALSTGQELLERGATIELAIELLVEHFRAMLFVAAAGGGAPAIDLSEAELDAARRHVPAFDLPSIVHAIALGEATARNARFAASARALFDALLVRLCLAAEFMDAGQALRAEGRSPGKA
ncbi:MAG: DNA polymerase III subunit gamma/tau [Phycisphaeraceae bacterium]|nr:DNA polymerase III subunit gamma/tau [Phycisphaeraceae bacterium]